MIVGLYFLGFYLALFLVVLILWLFNRKPTNINLIHFPKISILIAARNEESNITRCLQSLENLNYPPEFIEVLIGDDDSSDNTAAKINQFISGKSNFFYFLIQDTIGSAKGKANVLGQLIHQAKSDYFFITDADIAVPPEWVKTMLAQVEKNTGIVTGVTTVFRNKLFYKLQQLDWVYAIGLLQVISDLGLPVSTMGNNMLITRKAYESTGGYENLEFSVTEDILLFKKVLANGWSFKNIFHENVLALSEPAFTFKNLLNQRKRWMQGVFHLPWYMNLIFLLFAAYYPFLLLTIFSINWKIGAFVFAAKLVLQSIFIHFCVKRLKIDISGELYVVIEFYLMLSSLILLVYNLLPTGIIWKDRRY